MEQARREEIKRNGEATRILRENGIESSGDDRPPVDILHHLVNVGAIQPTPETESLAPLDRIPRKHEGAYFA